MKKNPKKLSLSRETLRSLDAREVGDQGAVGGLATFKTCGNPCSIACSNYTCETCVKPCTF